MLPNNDYINCFECKSTFNTDKSYNSHKCRLNQQMTNFKLFLKTVWDAKNAVVHTSPANTSIDQRQITTTSNTSSAIDNTLQHHESLLTQQVFGILNKNPKENYYQKQLEVAKETFQVTDYYKSLSVGKRKQVLNIIDIISQPGAWDDNANETGVSLLPSVIERAFVITDINNPRQPYYFNNHVISENPLEEPPIYLLREHNHYTTSFSQEMDITSDGDCFYKSVASQLPYYINKNREVIIYKPLIREALRCDLAIFILCNLPFCKRLQELISSINI